MISNPPTILEAPAFYPFFRTFVLKTSFTDFLLGRP
jgi:hypothetical protein